MVANTECAARDWRCLPQQLAILPLDQCSHLVVGPNVSAQRRRFDGSLHRWHPILRTDACIGPDLLRIALWLVRLDATVLALRGESCVENRSRLELTAL